MRLRVFFLVFIVIACGPKAIYNPAPEKDIKEWINNFGRQKSFSYCYEMRTKTVKVIARGDCIYGWAEHTKGKMDYGDTMIPFEYIGINDREWTKKGSKWEESVRGEESNILAQVERVLGFNKFELLNDDVDYLYQFNATLPFLVPQHWRDMLAYIRVSKKDYLPSYIWVGLPDSSAYWQISFSNYNKDIKIEPPYIGIKAYEIQFDSSINYTKAIKMIKRRLKLLNLKYKLEKKGKRLILSVPGVYSTDDIKEMLVPGITMFYGVTQKQANAVKTVNLQKNPNQSIYLSGWQCNQDMVKDVKIKFDRLLKPLAEIKLKKKIELPEQMAIEVDSNIVLTLSLDRLKKMDSIVLYSDMRFVDFRKFCAYIGQSLFTMDITFLSKGSD
ncbi:MAG: hypothetical protein ACUVQ3_08620 [bacterium]